MAINFCNFYFLLYFKLIKQKLYVRIIADDLTTIVSAYPDGKRMLGIYMFIFVTFNLAFLITVIKEYPLCSVKLLFLGDLFF